MLRYTTNHRSGFDNTETATAELYKHQESYIFLSYVDKLLNNITSYWEWIFNVLTYRLERKIPRVSPQNNTNNSTHSRPQFIQRTRKRDRAITRPGARTSSRPSCPCKTQEADDLRTSINLQSSQNFSTFPGCTCTQR